MPNQLEASILDYLSTKGPAFVQDIVRSRSFAPEEEEAESALQSLEKAGFVLIRPHVVEDPHLEGADLRIASAMRETSGGDAVAHAVRSIDQVWSSWLAEYLANHRCT